MHTLKFLYTFCCLVCALILFRCGSASSAEKYIIYASQQDFLKKVHDYKDNYPDNNRWSQHDRFYAPYEKSLGDTTVLFYYFDIYIPSEYKVFSCVIIPYDSTNTANQFSLRFLSISDTSTLVKKYINTIDLNTQDNSYYKHVFETKFLEELNVKWQVKEDSWRTLFN
jgi:hypothetical protein